MYGACTMLVRCFSRVSYGANCLLCSDGCDNREKGKIIRKKTELKNAIHTTPYTHDNDR